MIREVKTDHTKKALEDMFLRNAHDNELKTIQFIRLDDPEGFALHTRRKYIIELFDQIRLKKIAHGE